MQPSRRVVERQAYKQTGQTRRLTRPPRHVASYLSFTLPRDETMPPCYIIDPLWPAHTGTPTGGHTGQSPSPPPVKQVVTGTIIQPQRVWGERHVVNNRCETMCTSRRHPLLDNAATRRWWGRGENTKSCPADNLQSHRPPSRPTGQASRRPGHRSRQRTAEREVWTEVRGSGLIISNTSNRSSLTAASAHVYFENR